MFQVSPQSLAGPLPPGSLAARTGRPVTPGSPGCGVPQLPSCLGPGRPLLGKGLRFCRSRRGSRHKLSENQKTVQAQSESAFSLRDGAGPACHVAVAVPRDARLAG